MPQQLSPWLEGAYGWNFGESNWNTGIDNNQLKFSFMFDRNVDGVVGSLPAAVNGQAYFLTTDNRLYFAVGTTWFSAPTPRWFQFVVRSTGASYQFDGTTAIVIDSPSQLGSRLDAVEVTIASLGTAAFEDIEFFASQAQLDVAVAVAATYTDVLRQDLAVSTDPAKGAGLVAFDPAETYPAGTVGGRLKTAAFGELRLSDYADGAVIDAALIQAFLNTAARKHVVDVSVAVTKAGLEALPLFGLTVPAGGTVEWLDECWLTLEPGVGVRHIFTGQGAGNSRVTYINPLIDAQDSAANGIGANNAVDAPITGIRVIGGYIKNIARDKERGTYEGGIGVTFQYGCRDCIVDGTRFTRVHCATDASGNGVATAFGESSTYNIIFTNLHCENCEQIGRGLNLIENSSTVSNLPMPALWSNITFRNCGRSNEVGTWPGLSFTRVNNAGNSSPWTDIYIASTSYVGNWEPDDFAGADAEWTFATGSYAIGNRVKVINDGTLSSLFHFEGNAGACVRNVNGNNETAYGQIGALVSGAAGGVTVSGFDVLCDAKDNIHCGSCPNIWPVITRPDRKMVDSSISLSNIGTAINAIGSDGPSASDATPYRQLGLKVKQLVRRVNLTAILDTRIGGAVDGWRNSVEIRDCAQAGVVSGNFDFVFLVQNTIPLGNSSSAFNEVVCGAMEFSVYQSNNQLRLRRVGSNAGFADLYALGAEFHVANTPTITIDPDGGQIKLKNATGTVYALAVDASGRLTINGTVVGTQT